MAPPYIQFYSPKDQLGFIDNLSYGHAFGFCAYPYIKL